MIHFRAPLLGGVFSIGLMFPLIGTDIVHAAALVEAPGRHDAVALIRLADNDTPAWAAEATMNPDYDANEVTTQVADDAPPATGGKASTEYFGDNATSGDHAWDAPAQMNPDYTSDQSAAPAPAGGDEQAAPTEDKTSTKTQTAEDATPPATGGKATTDYYGDKAPSETPAWDAPAQMNPDYAKDQSATPAATEAPAAETAEEPAPPPTGGKATTEYYGDSESQSNPAWAEPAKMNPDYNAAAPAASESASSTAGACIESVTADAKGIQVRFSESSVAIAQEGRAALTNLAKSLKDCGGVTVEVQGFTDAVGSGAINRALSELRAKKVVDFLKSAGVDSSKLKAVGYGSDKAIGDNHTAEGRRLNRRVELVVSSQ
jgi:outer membrane protein OmpA-like peptidoglycan-associated protein